MNILQINASYKPAYIYGGPTMSVAQLSEQLVKNDCNVQVFTTTANGPRELEITTTAAQLVNDVAVNYFPRLTKDHSHFSPQLLLKLWKEIRSFDLVHIHAWWNLVSILSCAIAHLRKVPVILSPRGTLSPYSFATNHTSIKRWFHRLIGKFLLSHCHLHSTSEREQVALKRLLKPKSIFNIPNLVSLPTHIPAPAPENDLLRLLFLSRIEQKKGIELLFAALADLAIPYQLTIAGSGNAAYIAKLKMLSHQYHIEQHIRWLGFKGDDKFELMAQHDVLVLPSYDENFGNVVIESLCVGTAVLISSEVGLASFVAENNMGWICETNSESIKNQLLHIYGHPGKLAIIREFAPMLIISAFNNQKLIQSYLNMYQKVSRKAITPHD